MNHQGMLVLIETYTIEPVSGIRPMSWRENRMGPRDIMNVCFRHDTKDGQPRNLQTPPQPCQKPRDSNEKGAFLLCRSILNCLHVTPLRFESKSFCNACGLFRKDFLDLLNASEKAELFKENPFNLILL